MSRPTLVTFVLVIAFFFSLPAQPTQSQVSPTTVPTTTVPAPTITPEITATPEQPKPVSAPSATLPPTLVPTATPTAVASPEPKFAERLPIVEYHYSTFSLREGVTMKPEWFESQIRWLAENGFVALTSEQLVAFLDGAYRPPQRSVVLRFDVGGSHFADYTDVVIPTLRRYHMHGLFFIQASQTRDECEGEFTCWATLAGWQREGLISIGSHSLYHIDYTTLSPEQIVLDAGRSKAIIEHKLGVTVQGLCYPFDAVNPAAFEILKDLGYRFAVGGYTRNERSARFADAEPFNLPSYYPYSGEAFYPVLGGSGGQTFEELMLAAIETK
jgi:peptidoglycan/xylan/chitin deacetylase (PgdA/CDA1 family)